MSFGQISSRIYVCRFRVWHVSSIPVMSFCQISSCIRVLVLNWSSDFEI
jgi:hypothetical protein